MSGWRRDIQIMRLSERGDFHELCHSTEYLRVCIQNRGRVVLDQVSEAIARVLILPGRNGDGRRFGVPAGLYLIALPSRFSKCFPEGNAGHAA
jgi:hypothetical protein